MASPARQGDALPALGALGQRIRAGARVADVRCGDGEALVALARVFPRSTFHGFDADPAAIAAARRRAAAARVSDRVTFELASPLAIPADDYDVLIDGDRLATLIA